MALGLTQPLTEISTRVISLGVKVADALSSQPFHLQKRRWSLNLLEPPGLVQSYVGIAYKERLKIGTI